MDDNLFRIGKNILAAAKIPYNEGCWMRSGIDEFELRSKATSLVRPSDSVSILNGAVQGVVLDNYLFELMADGLIDKTQRKYFLNKWAKI